MQTQQDEALMEDFGMMTSKYSHVAFASSSQKSIPYRTRRPSTYLKVSGMNNAKCTLGSLWSQADNSTSDTCPVRARVSR